MASSDVTSASTTPEEQHKEGLVYDKITGNTPTYEPIRTSSRIEKDEADYAFPMEDRPELARLASKLSRNNTERTAPSDELQRWGTVAGMEYNDPRLNPDNPEFDFFLWARRFVMLLEQEGIRQRRAGFTFKDLNVSGRGAAVQLQKNVGSGFMIPFRLREEFGHAPERRILHNFNGSVRQGEMLIVLGRPGSGCSTFLKSICGEHNGLDMSNKTTIHYNGIPQKEFIKGFRGDVVYNQENEKHFPHLLVGQTLEFAAAARAPSNRVLGAPREAFSKHMAAVVMNVFGLSHTRNTKVGNDFVRGVSGGERKRVSIAEMALAGSPIAAWDNSTRGLDAATALEFVRSLKIASDIGGMTQAVAIYQASQSIYDIFDKALVLYEGRQIYFGPAKSAKAFFEGQGWHCPSRQTTGDFLTSVTNPQERKAKEGYENKVPRTPEDFEKYWLQSDQYKACMKDIEEYEQEHPIGSGDDLQAFQESKQAGQAKHVRPKSPYTISIPMQVKLCTVRAYQRLWNDKASTISTVFAQIVQALIIGSIFYGTPLSTGSFFAKGSVLFFAVLLNALQSIVEINSLYEQRPIVEKQASYAFYHPFTEALAGIVSNIPVKFAAATCFNLILYFLAGLRREPSQFFIFFLFIFISILTMSAIFRTIAASTKTISQALAIAGVMVLAIVIYTGFTMQRSYMHPWFEWISYANPIAYAFEGLLVNEVHGRRFPCASTSLVPPYGTGDNFQCAVAGAVAGQTTVSGDDWVQTSYGYSYSHIWRNLGFLFMFQIFFYVVYLVMTELNSKSSSTAEYLVFRRGHVPKYMQESNTDEESGPETNGKAIADDNVDEKQEEKVNALPPQRDIFTWRSVCYDITIKGEPRRLLDNVSGWVKPGTLTALMGVSGAGKTTLLDCLAQRTSIGVLTGDMLVNGKPLDPSFQRKTGYVQQQDLHLETTTVREALRFSATLRQPKSVSQQEKYDFVEDVIEMLNMEDFSEAIVGNPGEGLNVEQRKLLTIGVELAAKPALLLFLDEPTSGLDSQSSWSIIAFLRKLADSGQAVLSTIHQPSAVLFQEFDRLLFLAKGGKTVYFGDIGKNSRTLLDYFENAGARKCDDEENPAEYMLETVGAGPKKGNSDFDWHSIWKDSEEAKAVQKELDRIHEEKKHEEVRDNGSDSATAYAMPVTAQIKHVTIRVFQQYWRTPSYVYSKFVLGIASSLFIGFSFFLQNTSSTGLQNTLFAIFMLTSIFSTLVQQIIPRFVIQRSLYEVRERPSKAYSWGAFMFANIVVEIPYQILLAILAWAAWYWPVFGYHQTSEQRGLMLLFVIEFMVFSSTFAHMIIAAMPDAETAGNIATLLFSLMLTFNGVLQNPAALPGFWIFMYRVSPMTYLVGGWAAAGLSGRVVNCARQELAIFNPPSGQTCGAYLQQYLSNGAPGALNNPQATAGCEYCPLRSADQFLTGVNIHPDQQWRNFGIGFAYIIFNIFAAVALYYLFRVRNVSINSLAKGPAKIADNVVRGFRRMFARHSEPTPKGREAESNKVY